MTMGNDAHDMVIQVMENMKKLEAKSYPISIK